MMLHAARCTRIHQEPILSSLSLFLSLSSIFISDHPDSFSGPVFFKALIYYNNLLMLIGSNAVFVSGKLYLS